MAEVKDKILLQVDVDIRGLITNIAKGREELTKLSAEQAKLNEELKKMKAAGDTASQTYQDLNKEYILGEQRVKALTTEIRNQEKAVQLGLAADSNKEQSLRQLSNQLSASIREWNLLSEAERETSERGKALKESISQLNEKLKEQEASTGRNQRNVGNYAGALESVKAKLSELANLKADINKAGFENAQNSLDDISAGLAKMAQESREKFAQVQTSLIDTGKASIEQASSIRELTGLMKAYRDASLVATDDVKAQFVSLAAEAQDKLGDIKNEIKNLASDTSTFNAITEGVKTLVAGFTLAQGASQLFGDDNKNMQEALNKTAAALLVLNSVTEITNALQKESSLMVKATAVAQFLWNGALGITTALLRVFGITTAATTVGVRIFTAALLTTGIGAIAVAVGLLIQNFSAVTRAIGGVVDKIKDSTGVWGAILAPLKAIIVAGEFVVDIFKKIGVAAGLVDSERMAGLKNQEESLKKQGEILVARYDLEIRLAKAAGKATEEIELAKMKAQQDHTSKQIYNLLLIKQANKGLTDDQIKQLDELKVAWVKNRADILVTERQFQTEREALAQKSQLDLLNIELKREQLLGKSGVEKQKEIALEEYNNAMAAAIKKGENTTAIEQAYALKVEEIDKAEADRRRELQFSMRESLIAIMQDTHEKEIASEILARDRRLAAIKGSSAEEVRIRSAIKKETADKIKQLDIKFAQEEVDRLVSNSEHKLSIEKGLIDSESTLALAKAKNDAEKIAAEVEILNKSKAILSETRTVDRNREIAAEEKHTQSLIELFNSSEEAKNLSLEQANARRAKIKDEGHLREAVIDDKYFNLSLADLADYTSKAAELTLQQQNDAAQKQSDLAQLRVEAGAETAAQDLALRISQLDAQEQVELTSKQRTEEEKSLIHEKYEKMRTQLTLDNEAAKLGIITNALDTASGFFNKDSTQYKALAISKALINTYLGVTQSLATYPWPYNAIAAAASLAAGLQNVDQIRSQKAGFEQGGYTGDGHPSQESRILGNKPYTYHKSEYVIPAPLLGNPLVSEFTRNVIEPMRMKKVGVGSFRTGFISGGYTPPAWASISTTRASETSSEAIAGAIQATVISAIENLPNPIVIVEDINVGQSRVAKVAERSTI